MATEIVTFRVKEDFTPSDMERALKFLQPPPKGLQLYRWGRVVTQPSTVVFFLNWNTVEDHWAFTETPSVYVPFREAINSFLVQPIEISMCHTHLQPFLPHEMFGDGHILLRFLAKRLDISPKKFEATRDELLDITSKAPGFRSHFVGIQHEDNSIYIVLTSWDSSEALANFFASKPDLKATLMANIVPEKSPFYELKLHPQ